MDGSKIKNMEEFAALSGLSRPTVSKYFNDPKSVRASTRTRIESAREKYDYHPNIFAMNQNRKLTKNVGIVVPYLVDPFFAELARHVETHCIEAGFRPNLFSAHGNAEFEREILEGFRSHKPAGVLIAPLGASSDRSALEKFALDIPTVIFDSGVDDESLPFVGSDCDQFAEMMVDFLYETGEPPCFLDMQTPSNPNAKERRAGYIAAMLARGEEPQIVSVPGVGWDFEDIGMREGAIAIAERRFATNTVLCSNDRLAIGFIAACFERGLRVGRSVDCDFRVAGQDDHPFSRFTCPALTTVAQDYESIARRAVETLVDTLDGGAAGSRNTRFEGKLVLRSSA